MTDKKRNNGKRQIPSMDAKEFYEIFMRNHDECKKKIHDFVTSYLKEHKDSTEIQLKERKIRHRTNIEDFNILDFV